jgi:hypothetical protein
LSLPVAAMTQVWVKLKAASARIRLAAKDLIDRFESAPSNMPMVPQTVTGCVLLKLRFSNSLRAPIGPHPIG